MMCETEVFCKTHSLISAFQICVALTAPRQRALPLGLSSVEHITATRWPTHCNPALCGTVPSSEWHKGFHPHPPAPTPQDFLRTRNCQWCDTSHALSISVAHKQSTYVCTSLTLPFYDPDRTRTRASRRRTSCLISIFFFWRPFIACSSLRVVSNSSSS